MRMFFIKIKDKISKKDVAIIVPMALFFILIDQLLKYFMLKLLVVEYNTIEILPFFNLTLVFNQGVSFSFLYGINWVLILAISIFALFLSLLLVISIYDKIAFKEQLVLSLLIGGACGNIIDRAYYKAVIDYLHVYYNSYHFPVFNLADCFITLCAFLLILDIFFLKKSEQ